MLEKEFVRLEEQPINGQQSKNAVCTASALAMSSDEPLGFRHLDQVPEIIEKFMNDFSEMQK